MKKMLLLAALAVMAITASAQGTLKGYNGNPKDPRLTKSTVVQKSFQALPPKEGLTMRNYVPAGKRLTLDPTKVMPVKRTQRTPMALKSGQPLQNKTVEMILSKGMAPSQHLVNLQPTITLNEQTTANAKATRKAPSLKESYTALGANYETKEVEQWTMTPKTATITNKETGEETEADVFVGVIPTPDILSDLYPDGVPIKYTIEDDIITIKPQAVGKYTNEAGDTTYYVTLFSPTSEDFDGVINMKLGEDGKLEVINGNYICFAAYKDVEFEPFDEEEGAPESYDGWYNLYANVTYFYQFGSTIDKEYNAHGVNYFANEPADWIMQRGTSFADEEEVHFFVNMTPLTDFFADLYPDGIDVEYTQEGSIITVAPQVIASYPDEEEGGEDGTVYILICSGTANDGCIVLTEGEDGSLTTIEGESVILGAWETKTFDPTFDTYLGSYVYMDNVKYRLPGAAPEAPKDVAFEPNELVLFAGMGPTGYSFNNNLGVLGAYTPVSFRNNTFDIATNFEWTAIQNRDDESEVAITGTERDFSLETEGGNIYSDFTLVAYNDGAESEPFTWGKGLSFATDESGNDTEEKRYEDAFFYAGHGQGSFMFSDGTYATMTRQNPDYDLSFYINFATPDIAEQYGATPISKIYSYQGKPSTPLFLTGVTLPMVSFSAQDDFNLHISLYKCSRSSSGNLTLGDIIAEADATMDNVVDTYNDQSGITSVVFNELYREDEFGMSETLDYLFIEDEFVIVIDDWGNGSFSGVLGSQQYSCNENTSTWFERPGEEGRLRSYGGGWPMLFIGLDNATYGYLHTNDNTNLTFGSAGGEKAIHVDPMYYDITSDTQEPTYMLYVESVTVDGEEQEELPEWLTFSVANEDYTTATETTEDGDSYEYFVNGIDYDLMVDADVLPEDVEKRTAEIVFFQIGARLKVTVTQTKGGEPVILKGDVNGDGAVNVADISAIIDVMAGLTTSSMADVNGDGKVNVADISSVIDIMAGD